MYLIFRIGSAIYRKEAMGGGDIKFAFVLGAYFGVRNVIMCLFLSFFYGAVVSIFLILLKFRKREDAIPFGPAMSAAGLTVLFFGQLLWKLYLGA